MPPPPENVLIYTLKAIRDKAAIAKKLLRIQETFYDETLREGEGVAGG